LARARPAQQALEGKKKMGDLSPAASRPVQTDTVSRPVQVAQAGPATKPAASPGIGGPTQAPPQIPAAPARAVEASLQDQADDATVNAIKTVVAYHTERDHPSTSGHGHEKFVAQLRQSAIVATAKSVELQQLNTTDCLHNALEAKEELNAPSSKGAVAPNDNIDTAKAKYQSAEAKYERSKASTLLAIELQDVDHVDVNEVLAAQARAETRKEAKDSAVETMGAVYRFQLERDQPKQKRYEPEHTLSVLDLRKTATDTADNNLTLQNKNHANCVLEDAAAKARLSKLESQKNPVPEQVARAKADVERANQNLEQSNAAVAEAIALQKVDSADVIQILAPGRK
jgi:hypothetical protein